MIFLEYFDILSFISLYLTFNFSLLGNPCSSLVLSTLKSELAKSGGYINKFLFVISSYSGNITYEEWLKDYLKTLIVLFTLFILIIGAMIINV